MELGLAKQAEQNPEICRWPKKLKTENGDFVGPVNKLLLADY